VIRLVAEAPACIAARNVHMLRPWNVSFRAGGRNFYLRLWGRSGDMTEKIR